MSIDYRAKVERENEIIKMIEVYKKDLETGYREKMYRLSDAFNQGYYYYKSCVDYLKKGDMHALLFQMGSKESESFRLHLINPKTLTQVVESIHDQGSKLSIRDIYSSEKFGFGYEVLIKSNKKVSFAMDENERYYDTVWFPHIEGKDRGNISTQDGLYIDIEHMLDKRPGDVSLEGCLSM